MSHWGIKVSEAGKSVFSDDLTDLSFTSEYRALALKSSFSKSLTAGVEASQAHSLDWRPVVIGWQADDDGWYFKNGEMDNMSNVPSVAGHTAYTLKLETDDTKVYLNSDRTSTAYVDILASRADASSGTPSGDEDWGAKVSIPGNDVFDTQDDYLWGLISDLETYKIVDEATLSVTISNGGGRVSDDYTHSLGYVPKFFAAALQVANRGEPPVDLQPMLGSGVFTFGQCQVYVNSSTVRLVGCDTQGGTSNSVLYAYVALCDQSIT